MESEQKTVTLTIPAEVCEKLETEARLKGCSVPEVIPDMISAYRLGLLEKHHARVQEIVRSHPTPYTEEDVPRLVREVRKELAAERQLESRP